MSKSWLLILGGWLLVATWAAGQVVESTVSPAISALSLLGWTSLQLAAPLTALRLYVRRAPPGQWLLMVASAWLGYIAAVFLNQQLLRNFYLLSLLMISAALVGAIIVSLVAYRAAWRLPSIGLALAIIVTSFGALILSATLSLDPHFNVLWYRLNEGRLAHLAELARNDLAEHPELGRDVVLPASLSDLALLGKFSKIGDCADGPVIFLPQFYPLIGGDWSDGFVALPCTDPETVQRDNLPFGLTLEQHVGGAWWFGRY